MTIKYIPLLLGLSVGIATQAMEPAAGYKEKKAALEETKSKALDAKDYELFKSLLNQARNEKLNHSLQKADATPVDIQFAKAVEENDAAAVKELIGQKANVNIKWLGKPALLHALSNETINFTLIETLLASERIDVNLTNKKGNTALREIQNQRSNNDFCANNPKNNALLSLAKRLIQNPNCNLSIKYENGRTIFSSAIYSLVDKPLIEILLANAIRDYKAEYQSNISALNTDKKNGTYFNLLPSDLYNELKKISVTIPGTNNSNRFNLDSKDDFGNDALFYTTTGYDAPGYHSAPWWSSRFEMTHRSHEGWRTDFEKQIEQTIAQ